VKFLIDNPLSQRVAEGLAEHGHETEHVAAIGLRDAEDALVADYAKATGAVVITADSDFGMLASLTHESSPSIILLRGRISSDPLAQVRLIVANLPNVSDAIDAGAIVIIEQGRVRVRRLPIDES
jgi:predicted nuclease of predicted toxin-antitoxin system